MHLVGSQGISRPSTPANDREPRDVSRAPSPSQKHVAIKKHVAGMHAAPGAIARITLLVGLLTVLVLSAVTSAQAAITHPYTGTSFGPGGVGSGSFGEAIGVTVDQGSGDVFVLDRSDGGRVYKFDAAGEPADFSSSGTNVIDSVGSASAAEEEIAVDDSSGPDAGDIYVANAQGVRIYAASGALLGELTGGEMCGVAVDPSGEVYVGVYPETIRRYGPVTNPVTNTEEDGSIGGASGVCNVAADGSGDVYAASFSGGVTKFDALQFGSLTASGELVDTRGRTLAVDPTSGEVFIDGESQIDQYDGTAEPPVRLGTTGSSGAGALSRSFGVAVNHASGDVYAANVGVVEIFGPGIAVASASTGAATGVTSTDATLHGSVEPAGTEVTSCHFEYGTEAGALTQSATCAQPTPYSGSTPVAVTAQITGLNGGTTYFYRLVASGVNGTVSGEQEAFTTAGPMIASEHALEVGPDSASLDAEINPTGEITKYHVEYGETTAYGSSTPVVEMEASEAFEAVAAHVAGLQQHTTYHFRFVAENTSGASDGPDVTFTTGSIVADESFLEVGSSSAALSARIDPDGERTTYVVEYGETTAYGSTTPPVSAGAAATPVSVRARLEGLQPDTIYHFRFVAIQPRGLNFGDDVSLKTHSLSLPGLPDDRGYELVTPTNTEGAEPYRPEGAGGFEGASTVFTQYPSVAADDGGALAYVGSPTTNGNGSQGEGIGNQFLATRQSGGGWTQSNIQPPGYQSPTYWAFARNLEDGLLLSDEPLGAGVTGGYPDLYLRNNTDESYRPLSTVTPPNRSAGEFGAVRAYDNSVTDSSLGQLYAGASADFTHLLFEANDALASPAVDPGARANNLYEYTAGSLQTVNLLPGGAPAPDATFGAVVDEPESPANFEHVISSDGDRIFWTDMDTGSLYVRENSTSTSLIAEDATYLTASTDGSSVLYMKGGDLYKDDLSTGLTIDLAPAGHVLGIAGASEDLEYVYFVAESALAQGATANKPNLYLLHDGATVFIGTLGSSSEESTDAAYGNGNTDPWQADIGYRTAQSTPSGQTLVFMSRQSLTGYDNTSRETGQPEREVFVYDAPSGRLSCVSCNRSGEPPVSGLSAVFALSKHNTYQLHVISESGDRVFFESVESLVPRAGNGRLNVYEWERDGAGSCREAEGCIYLLSGGVSPKPSYFIDASASGDDVFLMTRERLTPSDQNEYNDIYDARVGAVEASAQPQCTGSGCQGAPAVPPVFSTPASTTFSGVGNFPPAPNPVSKPKPKKKKPKKCTKQVKHKGTGKKSARQAKAKPVRCKTKRAATRAPRRRNAGGRR